ncbi:lipopolysaccharide biosynthesis protein RfbH [Acidimicrobiia bacterium]|nr:lipopolysaccharide biosynthesis protein RfbH [Acidimicrobiia bacterium]
MEQSEELSLLEEKILILVEEYTKIKHKKLDFLPEISTVPINGRVFDSKEVKELVKASLDFWLTDGEYSEKFSDKMSEFLNMKFVRIVNSGSSANLVALSSLTDKKIKNRISEGDEIITSAVGFPTTVNPIFQNNLTPVFVDSVIGTYNPTADMIIEGYSEKTKAIFLAHTLGNPLEVEKIRDFCEDKNLWLIEDNCDALGSKYNNKLTGTFGHISTLSFYPAHHITMGEGGAVITNSTKLKLSIDSFRDWGRDCWCKSGHDNTCNKRFEWQLGELPYGYDHKFTYSNIGYNLKATDLQASIGYAQMEKLPNFIDLRKKNWDTINKFITTKQDYFIPHTPTVNSDPSWFGYAITVKDNDKFNRDSLTRYLNENRIATRLMFGGNLIKQPAYKDKNYRVVGQIPNADVVMNSTFWIGVYPGLSENMINYVIEKIETFLKD